MAKFGTQNPEYDPFGQISGTLAELDNESGGGAVQAQPPTPEPEIEPQEALVSEPRQTLPREMSQARQVEVKRPESSGAGQGEIRPAEKTAPKEGSPSALKVIRRFKTTKEEAIKIDRATVNLAAQLGIRMDTSKLTRALWEIYLTHEQEILRSVQHVEGLDERPSNRDAIALAEFDEKLAKLIGEGLMVACMRSRRNQ